MTSEGAVLDGATDRAAMAVAPAQRWAAPGLRLWLAAVPLFAIACLGNEAWFGLWSRLPAALRAALATETHGRDYFIAAKASVFLAALVVLVWPYARQLLRELRHGFAREDRQHALTAVLALLALSLAPRAASLGEDYQLLSLAPFAQSTSGLHRRILEVALAYYAHLNGALFVLLHFGLAIFLLMLLRLAFRRRGVELSLLELTSIATSAFVFHNFQYPGYPDVLVVIVALTLVTVELPPLGRVSLAVLALLAHEALAVAVLIPVFLGFPWRERILFGAVTLVYILFWAADFGFNAVAGFVGQINYYGHSGPELLMARPLVVLAGVMVAFKLLWLPMLTGVAAARRRGAAAFLRQSAPIACALGLCVLSYDTSRMAGMAFLALLTALPPLWERLGPRGRAAFFALNLALPSPYISPVVDAPWGTVWTAGLYSAYHGFDTEVRLLPPGPRR